MLVKIKDLFRCGVGHVEDDKMGRNLVVVNLERLKLGLGTIKTGQLKEVVNLERWSTYRGCVLYKYISGQSGTVKSGQVREVVRLRRWSTLEVLRYMNFRRFEPLFQVSNLKK